MNTTIKHVLRVASRTAQMQAQLGNIARPAAGMVQVNQRQFFKAKKDLGKTEDKEEKTEKSEKEEEPEKEAEEKKTTSGSSSEEELDLTPEDIQKIRDLIKEQDVSLEENTEKIEALTKEVKELKQKLVYQYAENDNTVKRYRKQIEDGKSFAISKFAKELLEVRDTLGLALEHCKLDKLDECEDIEDLKNQFRNIVRGQEMTTTVMDKVLAKFDVVCFDPLGEKFDPNVHDAVFMITTETEHDNNHVGQVMQSGWKIGERVLRAAKVGIVKK